MFSGLFSRKQPKKDSAPKTDAGAKAPADSQYDPGLVTALIEQHRALITLLIKARSTAQMGRYDDVKTTLEQFRIGLDDHLYQENLALLPYLARHIQDGPGKVALKDAQSNTAHIERSVAGFLKHYIGYPVNERTAERFDVEIEGVSEEFCERIQKEETTLYTLYQPPEAY